MKGSKQPFEFLTHLDHEGVPYEDDENHDKEQRHSHQAQAQARAQSPPQRQQRSSEKRPPPRQPSMENSSHHRASREDVSGVHVDESEGVFAMTGLNEEEKNVKEKPKTKGSSLRSKLFATLNLSAYTKQMAEENGPLKPGHAFYELLTHSHGLKIPIPDTFVIDSDARISHLCNDKHGNIQRLCPDENSPDWKEEFVTEFVERCMHNSVPVGIGGDSASMFQRPVGVLKRPAWRRTVRNFSQTVSPLALQAHMLDSLEPCDAVLQKYIKSKGRKPSFTRLFWKQSSGHSKSVVGWTISNVEDFEAPPVNIYAQKVVGTKNDEIGLIRAKDVHVDLKNHLYQGPSERAQIKVKEAKDFARFGHYNLCSLTNLEGAVTDTEMDKVSPFKMSPVTLEDPMVYTERIVAFLQKYAETREGLLVNVTEIVCDFIKDDNDKWWFIQIKGLRLCRQSRQRIHRWIKKRMEEDNADLEDYEDDQKESFQEQYKRKIREARDKAKENMDNQCKMCGIFYREGELQSKASLDAFDTTEDEEKRLEEKLLQQQKVAHQNQLHQQELQRKEREESEDVYCDQNLARRNIKTTGTNVVSSPDMRKSAIKSPVSRPVQPKPRNPSFAELRKETDLKAIADEEGVDVDMVPAYGYQITYKMAVLLTELFRNNNMFLTKYCHDILISEAQYNPSLAGGAGTAGLHGSTLRMGHNEKRPDSHVICCLRCFYVLESHFVHKETALKLYEKLGLSKEVAIGNEEDEVLPDECSAAELFRLNTGRTLSKKHKKGKAHKLRQSLQMSKLQNASTSSLVEAAATKLTDMHNGKHSASSSSTSSLHASQDPRGNKTPRDPVVPIEKDFMYKGSRCPFTSQHFEIDTQQWRLIFLFHNFLDVECNEGHPLYGAYGCMTYSLGQHTQAVSFRNKHFESDDTKNSGTTSRCVWIRQCRLHYLFASPKSARSTFSRKRVEFHLFFTPDDKKTHSGQHELRWEGSFHIDLNKLLFSRSTLGDDKFDIFVPVSTQTMGNLIAKISVSIAMSPRYSDDVHALKFHKENGIFWPPVTYVDHSVLPAAWLSMMTRTKTDTTRKRDKNQKLLIAEKFKSYLIDPEDLVKVVARCKEVFDKEFVMSDGTANCSDVLHRILEEVEEENDQSFQPLLKAIDLMLEDGAHLPARLRFEDLMPMIIYQLEQYMEEECAVEIPGGGRELGRRTSSDDDFLTKSKKREVARLSGRLSTIVGIDFQKAFAHLSSSRLQMRNQTDTRGHGQSHITGNDDILTRTADISDTDEDSEYDETGANTTILDAYMNHKSRSNRRLSKMASAVYKLMLENEVSAIAGLAMCAPSRSRRHRRGIVLLTIFEAVAKQADMVDVAELKQYLLEEKEKLSRMVNLVATKRIRLPVVQHRFDDHLKDNFSLLRSVICSLLLNSCRQLQDKFQDYDSKGTGVITVLGFLTASESCFREVSEAVNESLFSNTILELKREGEKEFAHSHEAEKINDSAFRGEGRGDGDLFGIMEGSRGENSSASEYEFDQFDDEGQDSKQVRNGDSSPMPRSRKSLYEAVMVKHAPERYGPDVSCEGEDENGRIRRILKEANFESEPVAIWLLCDLHGHGNFFLADLCCIKCETEVYQPVDEM